MQAQILKTPESAEYYFEEGCFILELSNSEQDSALSIARARVKAGMTTRLHRLSNLIERYVILSGVGSVEVADLPPQTVSAGCSHHPTALCAKNHQYRRGRFGFSRALYAAF